MFLGIGLPVTGIRRLVSVVLTTLNTADRNNATLSNGNLTVVASGAASGVRATTSKNSGKWYFEAEFDAGGAATSYFGVMPSNGALTVAGNNASSLGNLMRRDGNFYSAGVSAGVSTSQANLDVKIMCALDCDNDRIWWRTTGGNWNGNASNNPATNVGGISISNVAMFPCFMGTTNDGATFNFGATSFTQTPPSGFTAWNG